jgi:hypothetical protein
MERVFGNGGNRMNGSKSALATKSVTIDLDTQAQDILEKAEKRGMEYSFLFITTFKRYRELIDRLAKLQKVIEDDGATVTKEYVKGRGNIYVHPAVAAYNTTSRAADSTASLLLKYIDMPLDGGGKSGDDFDNFKGNGK